MPVYNSERKITAVTQLINKLNGAPFNDSDANIIEVTILLCRIVNLVLLKVSVIFTVQSGIQSLVSEHDKIFIC